MHHRADPLQAIKTAAHLIVRRKFLCKAYPFAYYAIAVVSMSKEMGCVWYAANDIMHEYKHEGFCVHGR